MAIALAECCIGNRLGATINLGLTSDPWQRWDTILFGEGGARILVSVPTQHQQAWEGYLQEIWVSDRQFWHHLGTVTAVDSSLQILADDNTSLIGVNVAEMADRYNYAIERRLS